MSERIYAFQSKGDIYVIIEVSELHGERIMKIIKDQREKQNSDLNKKFIITIGIIAFCILAYLFVIDPYLHQGEGDPYFVFVEVPLNATVNSSIIHLQDTDILNIRGLDVKFENGKLITIHFRHSDTIPAIHEYDFRDMYGSRAGDPSSRKYLEYKGVYYYGLLLIP